MPRIAMSALVTVGALLAVCGASAAHCAAVDSAAQAGAGWPHYGGDAGGQRYSPARAITRDNVDRLSVAWTYRTGDLVRRARYMDKSALQVTPVLAGGRLLFCTPFNEVVALDPGTGAEQWRFDAAVRTDYRPANQFVCRGVTAWTDPHADSAQACAERVYMGTVDARIIALDARDGSRCASFGAAGVVRVDPGMELLGPWEFQITSPPVVVGDTLIVGSSIGDNARVDAPKGTVRAYDVRTGAERWQFDPVARGAAERPHDWPTAAPATGHANVWAPMSVDESRGLVFLPTSSASPDFFGGVRGGDNRYANSVVALDGATGTVVWHFQIVHHDVWDYDTPAQPSLVTLQRDGRDVDAVVQVTKQGFVFVFDRDTGAPLFEVEERPVPQGGVTGERLSPTQPYPVAPPPLVPQSLRPEDAWGLTFWDRNACRKRLAAARSDGLYTPPTTQGTVLAPFTGGGANWGGAAFDPSSQTLFVNTSRAAHLLTLIPAAEYAAARAAAPDLEISAQAGAPWAMRRELLLSPIGLPCNPPPWGMLTAVDLATGTGAIAWESVLGTLRDIAPIPLPLKLGTPNMGGPIATAGGLVFIGAAMDDYLRAFDAGTGEELWKGRLPAGGQATPMTYEWRGRQYVVIAAGGYARAGTRLGDSLVAFALPE